MACAASARPRSSMDLSLIGMPRATAACAAVRPLSLEIASGTLVALLGPSGCGKTTTLRIIAGFEQADAGQVLIGGKDVPSLPPNRRQSGHGVPELQPVPAHDGAAQRRVRAEPRRMRQGRGRVPVGPGARDGAPRRHWPTAGPASSPAASSSAWRSRARSSPTPGCCCWTSRWARSTRTCARACSSSCGSCRRRSGSRRCW